MTQNSNPEQLQIYAAEALEALNRQEVFFANGTYDEARFLGLQVATGDTHIVGKFSYRQLTVREGEVRNRLTGTVTPEHTLEFEHIQNLGSVGINSYCRISSGKADLLTGRARYNTHTNVGLLAAMPRGAKNAAAWPYIMDIVSDLSGSFLSRYTPSSYPYGYGSPSSY